MSKIANFLSLRGICLIAVVLCGVLHLALSSQQVCGKEMNDALDVMCGGKGYNPYKTKRNFPSEENIDSSEEEDDLLGLSLSEQIFSTGSRGNSLAKLRRRRHGIYHECCLKPCSYSNLMLYCNP